MSTDRHRRYTLGEYLALERQSEEKYEYWNGEIFGMSGGSLAHDKITGNMFDALRVGLRGRDCVVLTSNMQIKVPAAPPYRYADGSVVCGDVEVERFNGSDLLLNPVLLYEVLSPTTEAYDRGDKFRCYKSISGLREYLLIAQDRAQITHRVKTADATWSESEVNDLRHEIYLPSLECTLPMSEIYVGVNVA
jgi:Uma2 family endonuclease